MPFTSNCEVFASVHEDAVNRVARHVQRQRPSKFNYATADIRAWAMRQKPPRLCNTIAFAPEVLEFGNPLIEEIDPLPVPGSNPPLALGFCLQLALVGVDFFPGKTLQLPPELGALVAGQFAIQAKVCGAIGCPDLERSKLVPHVPPSRGRDEKGRDPGPPRVIPFDALKCFCIDAFVVGSLQFQGAGIDAVLMPGLKGLELVDIKPDGLESSIECALRVMAQMVVLPMLRVPVKTLAIPFINNTTIVPVPAPGVSPNPAIDQDQLQVFLGLEVTP